MEFWTNPLLKFILTFFLVSVGFDFVNRMFLLGPELPPKKIETETIQPHPGFYSADETSRFVNGTYVLDPSSQRANANGREILVQYCSGCSKYKEHVNELEKYLLTQFEGVKVTGVEWPLPPSKQILKTLVTVFQFGVMIFIALGETIFKYLNMTPPAFYYRMQEKKFMVMIGAMLFSNFMSGMITNTGAFEVFLDGKLIFSKLREKDFPKFAMIADLLR